MKKEAEIHAEEDKNKQASIETKNIADTLVYTCEKTLKDNEGKIKPEDKKEVEDKINALKESQKGDNIDDIKSKTQELSALIQKIVGELYKEQPKTEEKPKDGEEPKAEEGKYTEK
jgi:molecular chaperone DnaK